MVVDENEKAILIKDLRQRLLSCEKLESCNVKDISRVRRDDAYLWLFIENNHNDIVKAHLSMIDCFKCRQQFGVNDILERNIDRRLFESGILYQRNTDRNGNPLLIFRAKLYNKDSDLKEVKKLFAFALEKMTNEGEWKSITLIIDMQEIGFPNMDMELIKFFRICFRKLFPFILDWLIVFETPWIWTAAWTVLKSCFVADGVCNLKFVNKQDVLHYIAAEKLPDRMGGYDTYAFSYPPHTFLNIHYVALGGRKLTTENEKHKRRRALTTGRMQSVRKQNFEGRNKDNNDKQIDYTTLPSKNMVDANSVTRHRNMDQGKKKFFTPWDTGCDSLHNGQLVTIDPGNEIVFSSRSQSPSKEVLHVTKISNNTSQTVAFKIKTTSPHIFRVVPCSGCLPPSGSINIHIFLQPGYHKIVAKEKFLILSTLAPLGENYDSEKIWRNVQKAEVMEKRLRCCYQVRCSNETNTVIQKVLVKDTGIQISNIENHMEGCTSILDNVKNELLFLRSFLHRMYCLLVMILITLLCILMIMVIFVIDVLR